MPKRSTHTYASEENEDVSQLLVYYCLYCGQTALILDAALDTLPRRKTDGSAVIETKRHMHKVMLEKGENKLIKRSGGFERQYRLNCTKCELPIAYQSVKENPEAVFILDGSLSAQPKVSFNEIKVPNCIQPTKSGDVKMKVHITVQGPRCAITQIGDDCVEITVKDCTNLGEDMAEKRQKELMNLFLMKTLGLENKQQITVDMGRNMKTQILLIKEIPPATVYQRLQEVMGQQTKMGYIDRHGSATAELFERMPGTEASEKYGTAHLRHKQKPTADNPYPDQPTLPGHR
jgi:hypothetical protein